MTIREYITKFPSNNFINREGNINGIPSFIIDESFQSILSDTMLLKYGDLNLRHGLICLADTLNMESVRFLVTSACNTIYRKNSYQYEKLFNTLSLEYNPIENYSMTENEKEDNTGNDNKTINKGEFSSNSSIGNQTSENVNSVSPYDSNEFNPESKVNVNNGSRSDSYIENAKTDTEQNIYNHGIERTLTRKGNIGVTTSQQMIESERNVAMFSLYDLISNDIKKEICLYMGV
jgi:hypothetical protein